MGRIPFFFVVGVFLAACARWGFTPQVRDGGHDLQPATDAAVPSFDVAALPDALPPDATGLDAPLPDMIAPDAPLRDGTAPDALKQDAGPQPEAGSGCLTDWSLWTCFGGTNQCVAGCPGGFSISCNKQTGCTCNGVPCPAVGGSNCTECQNILATECCH